MGGYAWLGSNTSTAPSVGPNQTIAVGPNQVDKPTDGIDAQDGANRDRACHLVGQMYALARIARLAHSHMGPCD